MLLKPKCMSLATCVAVLAVCFIALTPMTLVSVLVELLDSELPLTELQPGLSFAGVFIITMFVAGVVLAQAAYKGHRGICLFGLLLIVVLIMMLVTGAACSFSNQRCLVEYVCIEDRCPETLWTVSLQFRANSEEPPKLTLLPDDYQYEVHESPSASVIWGYVLDLALITAVVRFLINLGLLLYSATIVYSYSQEIKAAGRDSKRRKQLEE